MNESLQPSATFYDITETELDIYPDKPTIRLFQAGHEIFVVNFVENETLYIARKAEEDLRGRVESSSRYAICL